MPEKERKTVIASTENGRYGPWPSSGAKNREQLGGLD
jgi:hypothetical protein